jgi:hypothetical protein
MAVLFAVLIAFLLLLASSDLNKKRRSGKNGEQR